MRTTLLPTLALSLTLLTQCTTLPQSTLFEAHPSLVQDKSQPADAPVSSKTYKLASDWNGDGWVIKRGAEIRFNADGTGEFSCVTYAHPELTLPNAVQFQALQYGPDGNLLFGVPSSDVGESLQLRSATVPYTYLQLPTTREVQLMVGACAYNNKTQYTHINYPEILYYTTHSYTH